MATFTDLRVRLIATWGGRARIRRNVAIAIADVLALVTAFQLAFPEVSVENSAIFAAVTRVLTGLGVWLASRAMLRITGERPDPDTEAGPVGRHAA